MAYTSWRGTVGIIKPTPRPGALEELVRILPTGIGVIQVPSGIARGTRDEFEGAMKGYEAAVAELAQQEVDLILPDGAPPFMLNGFEGERRLIRSWRRKYKTPISTVGMNHVRALKALNITRLLGVTYFPGKINDVFARYFEDAGFQVAAMEGMEVDFARAGELAPEEVYAFVKKRFLAQRSGADGIYLMGSGWRILKIVELLEQDLGVPVLHPTPVKCWVIQKRLKVCQKVPGCGRLVADMLPG